MKTCEEWAIAFQQYFNNITSNKAPGMEPIEISRVLTDAEYSVVIGLYNGTLGAALESTEQVTAYLASLVKQVDCTLLSNGSSIQRVSKDSLLFQLPDDLLFITLELCYAKDFKCGDSDGERQMEVVPMTQDEYHRTIRNPFRRPSNHRALRLSLGEATVENEKSKTVRYSEILSNQDILRYVVRYIQKPKPIILEDLTQAGLSIDGYSEPQPCLLPEALHQVILTTAVKIAKEAWDN